MNSHNYRNMAFAITIIADLIVLKGSMDSRLLEGLIAGAVLLGIAIVLFGVASSLYREERGRHRLFKGEL